MTNGDTGPMVGQTAEEIEAQNRRIMSNPGGINAPLPEVTLEEQLVEAEKAFEARKAEAKETERVAVEAHERARAADHRIRGLKAAIVERDAAKAEPMAASPTVQEAIDRDAELKMAADLDAAKAQGSQQGQQAGG